MWERLRSIWTVPDLRNKILFTLGILLAFRVLANISVPLTQAEYTLMSYGSSRIFLRTCKSKEHLFLAIVLGNLPADI